MTDFQIWVLNADLMGCCLISTAVFIASPLLLVTTTVGALLGTLGGVGLAALLPERESAALLEEVSISPNTCVPKKLDLVTISMNVHYLVKYV